MARAALAAPSRTPVSYTHLMGNCANGVCVSIDDENFEHIGPDNVDSFFENEVMSRLH